MFADTVDALSSVTQTVTSGSLFLAIPLALAAGLISFLSPCVLPLVPGYLSYITGLTGAEIASEDGQQTTIQRVLGLMVIVLGLMFGGWIPGLQREWRIHKAPTYGLWGAPLLGFLFGLGWTPCIGPTLSAVLSLAVNEGSAIRGAILSLAYCVGLGIPFVIVGLAFGRAAGALKWVRSHYLLIMRIGGGMLVLVGLLLVTGLWDQLTITLRVWAGGFEVPI